MVVKQRKVGDARDLALIDKRDSVPDRSARDELAARFPAERDAPARARKFLIAALREWGYEGPAVDASVLALSELASNAVRHAESPFSISLRREDSTLRVAVHDESPIAAMSDGAMVPRPMHGLAVVDALALVWGIEARPDGKVVWARLSM